MVSRIRVDTRAASMEEAEREAIMVLDHARLAGFMEGVMPQSGRWADNHFENVSFGRTAQDDPEPWTELGLRYAGRVAFVFDPELVSGGGLVQYGVTVLEGEPGVPSNGHGFFALARVNPATREHQWEGSSNFLGHYNVEPVPESAEVILDHIRAMPHVRTLEVVPSGEDRSRWSITVTTHAEHHPRVLSGDTLLEAAQKAYEWLLPRGETAPG